MEKVQEFYNISVGILHLNLHIHTLGAYGWTQHREATLRTSTRLQSSKDMTEWAFSNWAFYNRLETLDAC